MKPGIRVLRGPDWKNENQDGGLGCLGTVVNIFPDNRVLVRWDVGTETECRAGKEDAFDLRIYDTAQIGIRFGSITCNGCGMSPMTGFRWKCLECEDLDLCTACYMDNEKDIGHAFVRYTTKHATVVRVNPRKRSRKIPLYGMFPGAEVMEIGTGSVDTEKKIGIVKEFTDLDHDSYHGSVKVEWKKEGQTDHEGSDRKPDVGAYRVGAWGAVELKMVKPGNGGNVYLDHLPVLDLTMPVDIEFNHGDRVRVDLHLDTFRPLMTRHGGWAADLEKILGEEGRVLKVLDLERRIARVVFERVGLNFVIYMNAMTKIDKINAGNIVKIIDSDEKMKRLQIGHGGWQMSDRNILGEVGRVLRIDDSRDAIVLVNGQTYVLNPSCLVWLENGEESVQQEEDLPSQKPVPKAAYRVQLPPGVTVGVGMRVVRGPDWSPDFGDQDGCEGHLGSVIEICGLNDTSLYPKQSVVVLWDNGEKNVYRAGYENAYDLKIYDTAGLGIKHDIACAECKVETIFGMLWQCSQCTDVYLCSECYFMDKHNIEHQFIRYDTVDRSSRNKQPRRAVSKKVKVKGIFEKSKVQRGPDWRWHNQDGGEDKTGEVIALVNFSPDTDRDAAEVTWANGYTNVYRLGYKGRLDVKCVEPSIGGYYYKDHIPILKLDPELISAGGAQPQSILAMGGSEALANGEISESRFKNGDKVKIEIEPDLLRMMEENRGAWSSQMAECIGKVGVVIVSKGNDITVDFSLCGKWTFHESVLTKLMEFVPGMSVKVLDSLDSVKMLQSGDWNDLMVEVIGKQGKVEEIDEDGDVKVSFSSGVSWVFNPECLKMDDSKTEQEPKPDSKPSMGETDEQKLQALFEAILSSNIDMVNRIARNNPYLILMNLNDKFAIHLACHEGRLSVVEALFVHSSKEVLLEFQDAEGCTPLLAAVKGGQVEMVCWLVEQGAQKDACDMSARSAVHFAVSSKNVPMVEKLRDLKFDVNLKDMLHQSAIFDAIMMEDEDIVTLILGWPGLDVRYQDSIGFTPFCIACRRGNLRAVKRLLEMAPDELNRPKEDGCTGLHMASLNNHEDIVEFLLEQDEIDMDAKNKGENHTALHLACLEGHLPIAKLLLDAGADKVAQDNAGKSALHLCLELSSEKSKPGKSDESILQMAECLLQSGVPHNIQDNTGKAPVDCIKPELKGKFEVLVQKWGNSASQGRESQGRPRRGSDPAVSTVNQGSGASAQMSQSLLVPGPKNSSPHIMDSQGGDKDPDICESCEEEPVRYKIEPCKHHLCADCIPRKKAKKKSCAVCGEAALEVEETRYS